jgi:hypothetical protein
MVIAVLVWRSDVEDETAVALTAWAYEDLNSATFAALSTP